MHLVDVHCSPLVNLPSEAKFSHRSEVLCVSLWLIEKRGIVFVFTIFLWDLLQVQEGVAVTARRPRLLRPPPPAS